MELSRGAATLLARVRGLASGFLPDLTFPPDDIGRGLLPPTGGRLIRRQSARGRVSIAQPRPCQPGRGTAGRQTSVVGVAVPAPAAGVLLPRPMTPCSASGGAKSGHAAFHALPNAPISSSTPRRCLVFRLLP